MIATGLSNVPFVPEWPGAFDGEIVHSADYRNPSAYRGRRVLVVGSGNSGAEIAVDLADGGASEVMLSVRTPPGIIRRDTLGVPSQLLGIASRRLPTRVVDRLAAGIRRIAIPDLAPYGLVAPARPYSEFLERRVIPVVDVGLADAVRNERVRVVAALSGFEDGAAILDDGSRVEVGRGHRGDRIRHRSRAPCRPSRRSRRAWSATRPRRRGASPERPACTSSATRSRSAAPCGSSASRRSSSLARSPPHDRTRPARARRPARFGGSRGAAHRYACRRRRRGRGS